MEKWRAHAQFIAMTNCAADDAAQHIATSFIGWNHPIGDQERARTDVVGNHAQGWIRFIGTARHFHRRTNQGNKQVNFVVGMHTLQNCCQSLQAHACIHAGRRQSAHTAIGVHFKLHKDVVPNFDETVAVFFSRTGRPTPNVFTVIVKNFRARPARPSISHHPKVIGFVFAALVVANANHALRWQTDFLRPNIVGFIVLVVHGCQ